MSLFRFVPDVADGDDNTCLDEEENEDEEEVPPGASKERNIELFDLVTVTDAVCLELEDVEEEEEVFEDVLLNGFCSNAVRIF